MANLSNINNKFIVTDGGHVSIGATTTTYPLTVESGGVGTVLRAGTSFVSIDSVGSATSPSLIFNGDSNTGMWRPASDTLGFSTAGVERMRIDSVGRVGIGTDSPSNKLHVQQSGLFTGIHNTAGIRIKSDGESANGNYHGTIALSKGTGSVAISAVQEANDLDVLGMAFFTHPSTTGTAASVERMRIDSDGNVGIGTATPDYDLDVERTATTINDDPTIGIRNAWGGEGNNTGFSNRADLLNSAGAGAVIVRTRARYDASANWGEIGTTTAHDFNIRTSATHRITVQAAGNVGIGVTGPGEKLTIGDTGNVGMSITDGTHTQYVASIATANAYGNGSTVGQLYLRGYNGIGFTANQGTATHMTILSGGNVGIGVTPSNTQAITTQITNGLSLFGNNSTPYGFISNNHAWTSPGGDQYLVSNYGASYYKQYEGAHSWATAPSGTAGSTATFTTRMTILSGGNVGIGYTSPGSQLSIYKTAFGGDTAGSGGTLDFGVGSTKYWQFRLDSSSSGDLAIDKTYANVWTTPITIQRSTGNVGIGTTSPAGIFHVDGDGASIYSIFSKSATKWLYLHTGGTNPAISWDSAGDMRFGTSTSNVGGGFSEKMRILSSGGITFNGDTAAANALDDYEEGTFQTNVNSTNVTNYSYSGDNGRYTKIGRQVIVTFVISSITAGTGLKYFVISNLPFTQHTSSHNEQGYCSNYPRGERRSGIIINNSSSEPNTWYVSYNNNSAQSNNSLRGTIIYTTTQ